MKNIRVFLSENFQFLEVKFSIYLNRHVFVMHTDNENTDPTVACAGFFEPSLSAHVRRCVFLRSGSCAFVG